MITINKMKKKDLIMFVSLWNQEYKMLTTSQFKMTLEKAVKGFEKKMFAYYGLFDGEKLIGFMLLKKNQDLWIKHLLIDKKFRKRGFGTLLLKKAEQIAKFKKLKLKTEVIKGNQTSINFFFKNGFRIIKFDKKEDQYILKKI